MKKIVNNLFLFFLSIWFVSVIYLSIHFMVEYFVTDLNSQIAKSVCVISFLGLTVTTIYNRLSGVTLQKITENVQELTKKKESCKSCKNKTKN